MGTGEQGLLGGSENGVEVFSVSCTQLCEYKKPSDWHVTSANKLLVEPVQRDLASPVEAVGSWLGDIWYYSGP